MPPTNALTPTRRLNWARLARNPGRRPLGWPAPAGSRAGQSLAGGPLPVVDPADHDPQISAAGPLQQAGGGHGPLAMAAHDRDRPLGELRRQPVASEGAEFDGQRAGQVAAGDLTGLADIQDH